MASLSMPQTLLSLFSSHPVWVQRMSLYQLFCKMLKGNKTHIRIYSDSHSILHKIQTARVFVKRQTVLYTEKYILCAKWSGNRAFWFLMSSCTCWHIAGRRCLCLGIRRLFQLDHCGSKLTPRRLTVLCNIWPMSNPLMTRKRLVLFSAMVRLMVLDFILFIYIYQRLRVRVSNHKCSSYHVLIQT